MYVSKKKKKSSIVVSDMCNFYFSVKNEICEISIPERFFLSFNNDIFFFFQVSSLLSKNKHPKPKMESQEDPNLIQLENAQTPLELNNFIDVFFEEQTKSSNFVIKAFIKYRTPDVFHLVFRKLHQIFLLEKQKQEKQEDKRKTSPNNEKDHHEYDNAKSPTRQQMMTIHQISHRVFGHDFMYQFFKNLRTHTSSSLPTLQLVNEDVVSCIVDLGLISIDRDELSRNNWFITSLKIMMLPNESASDTAVQLFANETGISFLLELLDFANSVSASSSSTSSSPSRITRKEFDQTQELHQILEKVLNVEKDQKTIHNMAREARVINSIIKDPGDVLARAFDDRFVLLDRNSQRQSTNFLQMVTKYFFFDGENTKNNNSNTPTPYQARLLLNALFREIRNTAKVSFDYDLVQVFSQKAADFVNFLGQNAFIEFLMMSTENHQTTTKRTSSSSSLVKLLSKLLFEKILSEEADDNNNRKKTSPQMSVISSFLRRITDWEGSSEESGDDRILSSDETIELLIFDLDLSDTSSSPSSLSQQQQQQFRYSLCWMKLSTICSFFEQNSTLYPYFAALPVAIAFARCAQPVNPNCVLDKIEDDDDENWDENEDGPEHDIDNDSVMSTPTQDQQNFRLGLHIILTINEICSRIPSTTEKERAFDTFLGPMQQDRLPKSTAELQLLQASTPRELIKLLDYDFAATRPSVSELLSSDSPIFCCSRRNAARLIVEKCEQFLTSSENWQEQEVKDVDNNSNDDVDASDGLDRSSSTFIEKFSEFLRYNLVAAALNLEPFLDLIFFGLLPRSRGRTTYFVLFALSDMMQYFQEGDWTGAAVSFPLPDKKKSWVTVLGEVSGDDEVWSAFESIECEEERWWRMEELKTLFATVKTSPLMDVE